MHVGTLNIRKEFDMSEARRMAVCLNTLIEYRDKVSNLIGGDNLHVDTNGDYDDILLETIQKIASEHDCIAVLDSNSTPIILSNFEHKIWNEWLTKTGGEDEWYWTSYYMDRLRSNCECTRFDYDVILDICRMLIKLEIDEPIKSGWMFKQVQGYVFDIVYDVEDWFIEIVTDEDSDIDMILEACRKLILVHIQDIEKFLI